MEKNIEYHCPECFNIPIYDINQNDFETINVVCPNNHKYKYTIQEFFNINPFQNINIKCNHCSSIENNIYNLFYCIECRKYKCQNDMIKYHNNCKDIIKIDDIFATCLEHNSPIIKFCKSCYKEICYFCLLYNHSTHILSEVIFENLKVLNQNKYLEKYFIENLINENKDRKIYNNIIKFLQFIEDILTKEISKRRFSFILYVNIINIYHSLYLFKKKLSELIKDNNNTNKNIENIIDKFYDSLKILTENINKNNYSDLYNILYNHKSNYFLSIYYGNSCDINIVKDNKYYFIKNDKRDKPLKF